MERLSGTVNPRRNKVGAIILSASLLFANEQSTYIGEPPSEQRGVMTKNLISPFNYDVLESNILAGIIRDPETNQYITVKDELPSPRDEAFYEGLKEPIAQLGRTSRTVDTILATESNQENGQFDPNTKVITLFINSSPYTASTIFKNPKMIPKALDHEMTHALNNDWYNYLSSKTTPENPTLAAKITRVASSCIAMNRLILGDFIDENRELVASSFENAEKLVYTFHSLNNMLTKDYRSTMKQVAEAVRENNPVIYDAPKLHDPSCEGIDISSIAYSFSGDTDSAIGSDLMYKMSLMSIQSQLNQAAQRAFACITEGKALSELLHDSTPLTAGHPQDDPTETASSIVTTLSSNPKYFAACVERMPKEKKQALLAYISAEIDIMSNTHPQLISILRTNPEASEVMNKYIAIDKQ